MVVEDIPKNLVTAAEEGEEEGKEGGRGDHLTVAQEDQSLDHGAAELGIEDLVVL